MNRVVMFSGGKDSSALVHLMLGLDLNFETVFCDTGWELPETIEFIDEFDKLYLQGKLIRLKSEKYESLPDLIKKRGHVPSVHARFCTEELKIKPLKLYLSGLLGDLHLYNGIRAAESNRRALMLQDTWDDGLNAWVHRPLLDWTDQDVFQFLDKKQSIINPLYKMGVKRVGCGPCVMCSLKELAALRKTHPERIEELRVLEHQTGRTFFSEKMVPERFRTGKSKNNKSLSTVDDIMFYIEQKPKYVAITDDVGESCFSYYGLCE